jgi:hypothetical protein
MSFIQIDETLIEVEYKTESDMQPAAQTALLEALELGVAKSRMSIFFRVLTLGVPVEVVPYWLDVTARLSPRLCAMAIVSDSLTVRSAARGFSVTNVFRGVEIEVRAFKLDQSTEAAAWLRSVQRR